MVSFILTMIETNLNYTTVCRFTGIGIQHREIKWFESYLQKRSQRTMVNGHICYSAQWSGSTSRLSVRSNPFHSIHQRFTNPLLKNVFINVLRMIRLWKKILVNWRNGWRTGKHQSMAEIEYTEAERQ